jgi:hypothetical protein
VHSTSLKLHRDLSSNACSCIQCTSKAMQSLTALFIYFCYVSLHHTVITTTTAVHTGAGGRGRHIQGTAERDCRDSIRTQCTLCAAALTTSTTAAAVADWSVSVQLLCCPPLCAVYVYLWLLYGCQKDL